MEAVAKNFAQLDAFNTHSKLEVKKSWSDVPEYIIEAVQLIMLW